HVEREHAPVWRTSGFKTEFRFRINKLLNKPGRSDAIDLRPRPSEPDLVPKISRLELGLWFRSGLSLLELPQDQLHIFSFGAVKKIGLSDLAKLFSNPVNLPAKI